MKLLFIGDIVGPVGLDLIKERLSSIVSENKIDFVIANGENINAYDGISPKEADALFLAGVDVITTGNHAFRQKNIFDYMDDKPNILRPANYPPLSPGHGVTTLQTPLGEVAVLCLMGQFETDAVDNPFLAADKLLSGLKADYIFVDFHAQFTSEKRAFGYYLDGRVNGVYGTHTHIQTADEQFLDKGTAYITDVGMTGAMKSVLGVKVEASVKRFVTRVSVPYEKATENPHINAVITDFDNKTITRIN